MNIEEKIQKYIGKLSIEKKTAYLHSNIEFKMLRRFVNDLKEIIKKENIK